jgi:hypothetical protein
MSFLVVVFLRPMVPSQMLTKLAWEVVSNARCAVRLMVWVALRIGNKTNLLAVLQSILDRSKMVRCPIAFTPVA